MLPYIGHARAVRTAIFSASGDFLVSGADDGRVLVWDRFGTALHTIPVGFASVRAAVCLPDQDQFCAPWRYTSIGARAIGDTDRLRFWNLTSGKVVSEPIDPADAVAGYWARVTGTDPVEIPIRSCEAVSHLACLPDVNRMLVLDQWQPEHSDASKWVCEYEIAPPYARFESGWLTRRRGVRTFAVSRDGRWAAVATKDWVRAGPVEARAVPPGYSTRGAVSSLALSADGTTLAGCWADQVTIWDTSGRGTVREFTAHSAWVEAVATHPTEALIASAGHDGLVILWEPTTGTIRERYDWGLGPVHALAFSPDGLTLAVAGDGGLVCIDLG